MNHNSNLIKMANDIGAFFEAMPDQHQAAKEAATHIKKFWEARMQKALREHLKAHGDGELKPVMREAVKAL
jgi:formate dehydrogenase subunit delta